MIIPYTGPAIEAAQQNPLQEEVEQQQAHYEAILADYRERMREIIAENERLRKDCVARHLVVHAEHDL